MQMPSWQSSWQSWMMLIWKTTGYGRQTVREFQRITQNVLLQGHSGQTGFYIYTLLRTRILSHDYRYAVFLYGEEWYGKEGKKIGDFDVSFLYRFFESAWQELLLAGPSEAEQLLLEYLPDFHKYVVEILRFSAAEFTSVTEYKELEKGKFFEIQAGEFFEPCNVVYRERQEKSFQTMISVIRIFGEAIETAQISVLAS